MIKYGLYKNIKKITSAGYYVVLDEKLGIYCCSNKNELSEFGKEITIYGYKKIEEYMLGSHKDNLNNTYIKHWFIRHSSLK